MMMMMMMRVGLGWLKKNGPTSSTTNASQLADFAPKIGCHGNVPWS